MEQLELRRYSRAEIAEILNVNINDSRHFKRNVENKLNKWGYLYYYTTQEVTIIFRPETPEQRLAELLYRGFGIDIQVSPVQFACFLAAFTEIDGFCDMPWGEKEKAYYEEYGYCVDERTLRNWCSKLIAKGIVARFKSSAAWRTEVVKGIKYRSLVQEDELQEVRDYYSRRSQLFAEYNRQFKLQMKEDKAARNAAWKETYKDLWSEFSCCYYYCKHFSLSAFTEQDKDDLYQVYELVQKIRDAVNPEENKKGPKTKEDFNREWGF